MISPVKRIIVFPSLVATLLKVAAETADGMAQETAIAEAIPLMHRIPVFISKPPRKELIFNCRLSLSRPANMDMT
jgi:hypothetical protein